MCVCVCVCVCVSVLFVTSRTTWLTLCATDVWFMLCTNKIYTYILKKSCFIFPITKGSVYALMKFERFSTSNKVKNHWHKLYIMFGGRPVRNKQE